jgi:hypothetical protein
MRFCLFWLVALARGRTVVSISSPVNGNDIPLDPRLIDIFIEIWAHLNSKHVVSEGLSFFP